MIIKKTANRILDIFGHRIVSNRLLPPPNHEILGLYLHFLAKSGDKRHFVQVGACDGIVSDQAVDYIDSANFNSLLVEPVPANFRKLEALHRGKENVACLNVAVSDTSGTRVMYTVADEGRWKDSPVARQIASFDRGHLERFGIKDSEIRPMEIPCMTLPEVMAASSFPSIDLLQIDTEGFDAEVVKMALALPAMPKAIYFEYCQIRKTLHRRDFEDVYARLRKCGYRWVHDLKNTLAILHESD